MYHGHRILILVWPLAMFILSACSPGGFFSGDMMWAPHRPVEVTEDATNAAKRTLAEGDRAGSITLTETEFSSLLHLFLIGRDGESSLFRDINVWFEPDRIYLKTLLKQGTIPGIATDVALNLETALTVQDGEFKLDVKRVGMGVVPILTERIVLLLEDALNARIRMIGAGKMPADIHLDTGTIAIEVP